MLNKTTFAQMMTMLCEVYDKPLTKTLSNTYYYLLQEMEDEDFKQAVKQMLKERIFATLPKPAEILSYTSVKEVVKVDNSLEDKAKELINLVMTMNNQVFQDAKSSGRTFEEQLNGTKFVNVPKEDMAVLERVQRYPGHKNLVANINVGWGSVEQLEAFKNALKYEGGMIGHTVMRSLKGNM